MNDSSKYDDGWIKFLKEFLDNTSNLDAVFSTWKIDYVSVKKEERIPFCVSYTAQKALENVFDILKMSASPKGPQKHGT